MFTRIGLLFSIVWLIRLTAPWFHVLGQPISGRDLILAGGGLFLLAKSVLEIHHTLEGAAAERHARAMASFLAIVVQIAIIDIVFSLDSVFTAVGLARPDQVPIMVAAIVVSIIVMMWAVGPDLGLRRPASDDQDTRARLPDTRRRGVDRARGWTCTSRRATCTSRWPSRCSSR